MLLCWRQLTLALALALPLHRRYGHCASFIARLPGIGVKRWKRKFVCSSVVHRNEHVAGLDRACNEGGCDQPSAARYDAYSLIRGDTQPVRVGGVDLHINLAGIQLS